MPLRHQLLWGWVSSLKSQRVYPGFVPIALGKYRSFKLKLSLGSYRLRQWMVGFV